jgi:hypothetical protein
VDPVRLNPPLSQPQRRVQITLTFGDLRGQDQRVPDIGLVRHPTPLDRIHQLGDHLKRVISIKRSLANLIKIVTGERLGPRHEPPYRAHRHTPAVRRHRSASASWHPRNGHAESPDHGICARTELRERRHRPARSRQGRHGLRCAPCRMRAAGRQVVAGSTAAGQRRDPLAANRVIRTVWRRVIRE